MFSNSAPSDDESGDGSPSWAEAFFFSRLASLSFSFLVTSFAKSSGDNLDCFIRVFTVSLICAPLLTQYSNLSWSMFNLSPWADAIGLKKPTLSIYLPSLALLESATVIWK